VTEDLTSLEQPPLSDELHHEDEPASESAPTADDTAVQERPRGLALLGDLRDGAAVLVVVAIALSVAVFGSSGQALVTAVTASTLVVLAAIDIEHRILPNRIVLPATAAVLVLQLAFFPEDAVEWLLAGPAAAAFLALPLLARKGGVGGGDIKLALLMGAAVGWQVFAAILVGCLAIVPVALWMLVRKGSIRGATLPFGPFLAFGTLAILFTS
jgi:leader peptidase (prepilin peptidase)/N-methyltransferase